jgi:hypothetical protein
VTKRPTPPPLTKTERDHLAALITRGARALNPTEGNRLLRLLELDAADRQQERRTAGGLNETNRQLRQQLKDAEAEVKRQHDDCQAAEAKLAAVREFADQDQDGLCCSHVAGQLRRLLGPVLP